MRQVQGISPQKRTAYCNQGIRQIGPWLKGLIERQLAILEKCRALHYFRVYVFRVLGLGFRV